MNEKEIAEYMRSHKIMQLATSSKNKPWICSVFYTVDNEMNLFFISNPSRRHSLEIMKNKNVACAITDSSQEVTKRKKGLQIEGTVSLVTNEREIEFALNLWNESNSGLEKIINFKNYRKKKMEDKVYKIVPKNIKIFDEEMKGTTRIIEVKK